MTKAAYLDTSCLVAVAFEEVGHADLADDLGAYSDLFASNLLEAELRAAFVREDADRGEHYFTWITWVLPDRPLSGEIARVLGTGYGKGADVWHLATALYLVEDPGDLPFLTLDARQRKLARGLGFPTPL